MPKPNKKNPKWLVSGKYPKQKYSKFMLLLSAHNKKEAIAYTKDQYVGCKILKVVKQ